MLRIKKNIKIEILSILLLGIFLIYISTTVVAADNNYNIALKKGTDVLEVTEYDEDAWKSTISKGFSPYAWFGGSADEIHSKSKYTTLSWFKNESSAMEVFYWIFSLEVALLIDSDYEYDGWAVYQAKWNFTSKAFKDDADITEDFIPVFLNPEDFKRVLDDYNDLAPLVPVISADDFLLQLILKGLIIPKPFEDYLTNLIDALECSDDVRVKENVLTLERSGEEDYIFEISYGSNGMISSFVVSDTNDNIIYKITRNNFHVILFPLLLGISGMCLLGVILILYRKKKKQR